MDNKQKNVPDEYQGKFDYGKTPAMEAWIGRKQWQARDLAKVAQLWSGDGKK